VCLCLAAHHHSNMVNPEPQTVNSPHEQGSRARRENAAEIAS
jgi:hypothetical protein